jgi:hypothetical protein
MSGAARRRATAGVVCASAAVLRPHPAGSASRMTRCAEEVTRKTGDVHHVFWASHCAAGAGRSACVLHASLLRRTRGAAGGPRRSRCAARRHPAAGPTKAGGSTAAPASCGLPSGRSEVGMGYSCAALRAAGVARFRPHPCGLPECVCGQRSAGIRARSALRAGAEAPAVKAQAARTPPERWWLPSPASPQDAGGRRAILLPGGQHKDRNYVVRPTWAQRAGCPRRRRASGLRGSGGRMPPRRAARPAWASLRATRDAEERSPHGCGRSARRPLHPGGRTPPRRAPRTTSRALRATRHA